MIINSITIRNFRGIQNQTISDINNALILIGKNNSGKSAFLTAVRVFLVIILHKQRIIIEIQK